jgi:hypothetical protein
MLRPTLDQMMNTHRLEVTVSQLSSEALLLGLSAFRDYERNCGDWDRCFVARAGQGAMLRAYDDHGCRDVYEAHLWALRLRATWQVGILATAFDHHPARLVGAVVDELVRRANAHLTITRTVDALLAEGAEVPV